MHYCIFIWKYNTILATQKCLSVSRRSFKNCVYFGFLKNWPTTAYFLFIFGLLKQTIQFLQEINVKKCQNVHPVYGAGNQTHNLSNISRHP